MHLDGTKPAEETKMDTRDLTCPICMCIAEDPQITSCCHRVFCTKDADIDRYNNGCPLCREKHFSFRLSPKHKDMLEQLTIKCACSQHIAPDEYENHLERCSDVRFPCPHNVCREKNDSTQYNSGQLVNHLARHHCDEVPLLGSTYINKKSVESYKKTSIKYDDLITTLYSVIYPEMIDIQFKKLSSLNQRHASLFKCPHAHKLLEADHTKRKRKNGTAYNSSGFNCDLCHQSFSNGVSWHCSCTDSGFDKCVACLAFQLYNINNPILRLAGQDREKQQERDGRETFRNIVRLPRGLFRLLTGNMDDDNDNDDLDLLTLRQRSSVLSEQERDDEETNLRED